MNRSVALLLIVPSWIACAQASIVRIDNGALITELELPAALQAGVDLSWADLRGLQAGGLDFDRTTLDHADLSDALLQGCDLERCSLRSARLDRAGLLGCDFSRADLGGSTLHDALFDGGDLDRARLDGVAASSLVLRNLDGRQLDLSGSSLPGARFENLSLADLTATGATFSDAVFSDVDLDHAEFGGAFLQRAEFVNVDLRHASLDGARLDGFWIRQSNAGHANFEGAWMGGAHWEGSVGFGGAVFVEACHDLDSVFPAWFSPDLEGMVHCDGESVEAWDSRRSFGIRGCWPNPFNPSATIRFETVEPVDTRLEVFDIAGREVAVLQQGPLAPGAHEIVFDGSGQPSGLYLVRLSQPGLVETQAILLVK